MDGWLDRWIDEWKWFRLSEMVLSENEIVCYKLSYKASAQG